MEAHIAADGRLGEGTEQLGGKHGDLEEQGEDDEQDQEENLYSRAVAGVLYLTSNWKPSFGGSFVDLEASTNDSNRRSKKQKLDAAVEQENCDNKCIGTGAKIQPEFNRLVLFRVPRSVQQLHCLADWFFGASDACVGGIW